MKKLKTLFATTALAGCAALVSQGAYAVMCTNDIGTLSTTAFVCDQTKTAGSGLFLDTINFEVDPLLPIVTITSTVDGINFFAIPIFENTSDSEFVADNDGQHFGVDLSTFAGQVAGPDYHIHPQGQLTGNPDSYTLTFSAAASPVPVPAAAWLFLSGLTGLGVLTRRKQLSVG
jgi:hypothetical protein